MIGRGLLAGGFGKATVSRRRKLAALLAAGAADLCQMALFPLFFEGGFSPLDWAVDIGAAFVLLLILGFKWRLLLAFAAELVPGLDLFPTWTALVLSLPTLETESKPVLQGR